MDSQMSQKVTWSFLELTGLLEDEDAHVHFEKTTKHLALHPFHLNDIRRGLNQILKSSLNTYDKELKGFMLAFKNPRLLSHLGELFYDSPFIHIDIEADFYLFRPSVGSFLKGVVNKKGLDHIVVLVHKTYTISIPKPDDMEEWPGDLMEIGQEVRCCVTKINNKSRPPFICATLKSDYLQGCRLSESINNEMDGSIKNQSDTIKIDNSINGVSEDYAILNKERDKRQKKHKKNFKSDIEVNFKDETKAESSNNMGNDIYRNIKYNDDIDNSTNSTITIDSLTNEIPEDDAISDKGKIKRRKKHKRSRETDTESVCNDENESKPSKNIGNDVYRNIKCEDNIDSSAIESHNLNSIIKTEILTNRVSEDDATSDKERLKRRKKHKKSRESALDEIESNNNVGDYIHRNIKRENSVGNTSSDIETYNLNSTIKIENSINGISEDDAISDKEKIKRRKKHKKSRETDTECVLTDENTLRFDHLKRGKKRKKTSVSPDSEIETHIKIKVERSDSDLEYPVKVKVENV